ncbi:MAG: CapA family protein [Ruminococcus sp.]|nr:CapA family protein [Ruminococcus sp.]
MDLRKMRSFSAALLTVIMGACFAGCSNTHNVGSANEETLSTTTSTEATTTAEPTTEPVPEDKVAHVVAVGDNLIHYSVYKNAEEYAGGNGFDFRPIYKEVKYLVESADVAVINQETVISESNEICGANNGVLIFNSPPEVADAVIDCGFDVITMANNHLLDMGADGLEESIRFWNKKAEENDLTVLGAYLNEEDSENIRIREVNGIKIAFLAYAEHLNGFSIPEGSPLRVILNSEEDVIERQIKKAREMADAVIVSAHWGAEDTNIVSDDRKELAKKMVDWGADMILGCHTHTAQTMEWITRDDGTKGFVYYSMGNFVCAQTDNFNVIGEMPDFDIVVDGETDEVRLENVKCIPTIVHYDDGAFSNMRVYPYSKYTEELANSHGLPYAFPMGTYPEFNWDIVNSIIEENFPAEFRELEK